MRDVGGANTVSAAAAAAAAEAARKAEEARKAAEAARKAEEARKAAEAAAAKAKQLEAAVKAERATDQLAGKGARDTDIKAAAAGEMADVPWAAEDAAHQAEKAAQFPKITAEDLKADPALGKRLAELAKDADPDVAAYVKGTATDLVKESLSRNLREQTGDAALEGFKSDIAALSAQTGLGEVMQKNAAEALKSTARDMLFDGVDAKEVADNPALGKVIATLKDDPDPAVQDKLKETVRGWTDSALKGRLEGKEGKGGVEDAMKDFRSDLRKLAEDTGLGDHLTNAAQDSLKGEEGRMKDIAEIGMSRWDKIKGAVGDFIGGALDLGGDVLEGVTNVAGDALNTVTDAVADGVKAGADLVGDVANVAIDTAGKGANVIAGAAADGLDAIGATETANATRAAGKSIEQAADVAGNVANTLADVSGQVTGGAVNIAGDLTAGVIKGTGKVANTGLDVAGSLASEGPMGAAGKLADKAIGPEKAEYAGQIDGLTGVITNRLGKGDSVFMNVEGGAEVGVGAFAGGKLNGAAQLSRDGEGNITLALAVGAEAEVGVSAETGATVNGVGAKADASASIEAQATGKINLKFNPDNPADVARLKAILEPTPASLAKAVTNPLSAAAPGPAAVAEAVKHNLASTEIQGGIGGAVGASAKASVGAASLKVSADANVMGSMTRKMNADGTDETKYVLKAGAKVEARATAGPGGISGRAQAQMLESLAIKTDASGNIIGMKGESVRSANAGGGIGGKSGFGAGGDGTVTKDEVALNGKGLAEAKRLMDGGASALAAYRQASADDANVEVTRMTTETDTYTVGLNGKAAVAGVKVGLDATATFGKTHTESERLEAADVDDLNILLGR